MALDTLRILMASLYVGAQHDVHTMSGLKSRRIFTNFWDPGFMLFIEQSIILTSCLWFRFDLRYPIGSGMTYFTSKPFGHTRAIFTTTHQYFEKSAIII